MSALKRIPSFGRKPKRNPSTASAAETVTEDESPESQYDSREKRSEMGPEKTSTAGSKLSRLARTASFGRVKKQHGSETEAASSADSSNPASPVPPHPSSTMPPPPSTRGLGSLHGWLLKKHTRDKTVTYQWAKRYFLVDDTRGTLCYSKGVTRKPSVVLPLIDITTVEDVDESHHGHFGFLISCPPVHLTVCAEDREDRILWVNGLRKRVKLWQDKATESGIPVRGRQSQLSAGSGLGALSSPLAALPVAKAEYTVSIDHGKQDAGHGAHEEAEPIRPDDSLEAPTNDPTPPPSSKKKKKKKKEVRENDREDEADTAVPNTNADAHSENSPHSPDSHRAVLHKVEPEMATSHRSPSSRQSSRNNRVGVASCEPARGGGSAESGESDDEAGDALPLGASKIETMEVMSDSDTDSEYAAGRRGALSREVSDFMAPRGNLNDLISSDEEEEEGESIPKDVPMPERIVPEPPQSPATFQVVLAQEDVEAQGASPLPVSVDHHGTASGSVSPSVRPWGRNSQHVSRASSPDKMPASGTNAAVDEAWDSEDEPQSTSPKHRGRASPSLPQSATKATPPTVGVPGIVPDKNFVEEDWDSDEE